MIFNVVINRVSKFFRIGTIGANVNNMLHVFIVIFSRHGKLLRFSTLVKFKWIIIAFVFIPYTVVTAETKFVTMPIIENIRIDKLPIAINEITVFGIGKLVIFEHPSFKNGAYRAVGNNAVAVSFVWQKINATINDYIKKDFSVKRRGFAIIGHLKRDIVSCVRFFYNKIWSIANPHGFFRNIILLATDPYGKQSKKNQSYILYKCKIYALAILSTISFCASIVCFSLIFQPSIRAFFGFGFSTFVFVTICHVSMEKEMYLRVFAKPGSAHQTNETAFAFNMLMVLIGIVIGLIVMYFVKYNKRFSRKKSAGIKS